LGLFKLFGVGFRSSHFRLLLWVCSVSATTASLAVVVVAFCGGSVFVLFMFIFVLFCFFVFIQVFQRLDGSIWIQKPERVWFY
jgi:hypothetical protein